jgi:hypothetical protein
VKSQQDKKEDARYRRWHKSFDQWQGIVKTRLSPDAELLGEDGFSRRDIADLIGQAEQFCYVPTDPVAAAEWLADSIVVVLAGGIPKPLPPYDPKWGPNGKPGRKAPSICHCCGKGKPVVCQACYDNARR